MKTLILFLLTLCACSPTVPTTDLAAAIDPFSIYEEADIAVREMDELCPDANRAECQVYNAAREAWVGLEILCDTYSGGICVSSSDVPEVDEFNPMWIECNVTPSGNTCGCNLQVGTHIIGIYADFGCDGDGDWINYVGSTVCDFVPCCDAEDQDCG